MTVPAFISIPPGGSPGDSFQPGVGLPAITHTPQQITDQPTLNAILLAAAKAGIEIRFTTAGGAPVAAARAITATYTDPAQQSDIGFFLHLLLAWASGMAGGSAPEPLMVETKRSGTSYRTFWLNENGTPRAASLNDEPALKLYGPDANNAYAGYLFQIFKRYSLQTHLWSIHTDGHPYVGTGPTQAQSVVLVNHGAAAPAGLPDGTIIAEKAS